MRRPKLSLRRFGVAAVVCGALLGITAIVAEADSGPTFSNVPGNISVPATSSSGAIVSYTDPTANDPDGMGQNGDGTDIVACTPPSGSTFALGTTQVTCTATDDASTTGSVSFNVTVNDVPPTIVNTPSDQTVSANTAGGATVSWTAPTVDDVVDGNGVDQASCTGPPPADLSSGDVFPVGTTTVTCTATDQSGDSATPTSFSVTVNDVAPTIVNTPSNQTVSANTAGGATVSWTAPTVDDVVDGNGVDQASCTGPAPADLSSGDVFPVGTTTVTCTATDQSGVAATPKSFNVTVNDVAPTIVNMPSGQSVSANTLGGATVSWTAPTVNDVVDGNGVDSASCSGPGPANLISGDVFPVGTTTVTCTATDQSGVAATPKSFNVTVNDVAPTIIGTPSNQLVAASNSKGATVSWTAPTVNDVVDGNTADSASCSGPGPANLISGDVFPIGATTVTCTATDQSGVSATHTTFTVTVTTHPVIVNTPANITQQATGPNGATVTWSAPIADDLADGTDPVTCSSGPGSAGLTSGDVFPLGQTVTITCNATDSKSFTAQPTSFTVDVIDTTPPVMTAPASSIALQATGSSGAVVSFATPTATDLVDGTDPVFCTPESGSLFPPGPTTVKCTATDNEGNSSSVSFTVDITDKPSFAPFATTVVSKISGTRATTVNYRLPVANAPVEGGVAVTCLPAPGFRFPFGPTTVRCGATSRDGSSVTMSFVLDLQDKNRPPSVSHGGLKVKGKGSVLVTWSLPHSLDVSAVVLTRRPGLHGQAVSTLFSGLATRYVDNQVKVGVHYTYQITIVAPGGLRSKTIRVVGGLPLPPLYAPLSGTKVSFAPTLKWLSSAKASYYNVQLWYAGAEVYSAWPKSTNLRLPHSWVYAGLHHSLQPGVYQWYVWPGYGPLSAAKYGKLLGKSKFTVTG